MDNWVIIGQPMCIWCERVRGLLSMNGKTYTYFDVEKHPSLKEFLKALGRTTVPLVFAEGEVIGGYEDTKEFIKWTNTFNKTT
jgi:glutaredoxin